MKVSSILGLLTGFGLIIVAIVMRGKSDAFLSLEAFLIVMGGTVGATLLSFNFDQITTALGAVSVVFFGKTPPTDELIPVMVSLVKQARVGGIGAVELPGEESERVAFLHKAVGLLEDGFEPEDVAHILKAESDTIASRYRMSERLFSVMGAYTPLFGLVGTLIGLIIMLTSVDDPRAIPPAMAVALITTFYGVLFSALLFRPIATKIRAYNYDEILLRELIIETLIYVSQGVNSQFAQEKLESTFQTKRRA